MLIIFITINSNCYEIIISYPIIPTYYLQLTLPIPYLRSDNMIIDLAEQALTRSKSEAI